MVFKSPAWEFVTNISHGAWLPADFLKHSAMLELPRGCNASGHKGVFQRGFKNK